MESQIAKTYSAQFKWVFNLGEIIVVFLPALLFIKIMSPWVGDDPIRSFTVIWVANILMLTMVWVGMRLRSRSWKDLGLTLKRVSFKEGLRIFGLSLLVFVFGIIAYVAGPLLVAIFTNVQVNADFSSYDYLKDNFIGLLVTLFGIYLVASFGEEVIYRAFLINRISELANGTRYNVVIAVIVSSVIFGLVHYQWGPIGIFQTGCMGLAMGISYIKLKKRLWILILAHAYMDTILMVQMYMVSN